MNSLATQSDLLAPTLLEHREQINFDGAVAYLAGHVRTQTPLGAAEYLELKTQGAPGLYAERLELAVSLCDLYRTIFRDKYALSGAPLYSLQREQEFYLLVNRHCFPLGERLEETIKEFPTFFMPCIVIEGQQTHDWRQGRYQLSECETVYKLAQVLSERGGGYGRAGLIAEFGLELSPRPPLTIVGWELFRYSCTVDESPLRYLPLAFEVTNYSTGCVWLDLPPGTPRGFDWNPKSLFQLINERRRAVEIITCVNECDDWLNEDPRARITHAIELWNKAAEVEASSKYTGLVAGPGQYAFIPEMPQLVAQMMEQQP
jgi:hypothetical protein